MHASAKFKGSLIRLKWKQKILRGVHHAAMQKNQIRHASLLDKSYSVILLVCYYGLCWCYYLFWRSTKASILPSHLAVSVQILHANYVDEVILSPQSVGSLDLWTELRLRQRFRCCPMRATSGSPSCGHYFLFPWLWVKVTISDHYSFHYVHDAHKSLWPPFLHIWFFLPRGF